MTCVPLLIRCEEDGQWRARLGEVEFGPYPDAAGLMALAVAEAMRLRRQNQAVRIVVEGGFDAVSRQRCLCGTLHPGLFDP